MKSLIIRELEKQVMTKKEKLYKALHTNDRIIQEFLSNDMSSEVRRNLALNVNVDSKILKKLEHDPVSNVVYSAINNKNAIKTRTFDQDAFDNKCITCDTDVYYERCLTCQGVPYSKDIK